MTRIIAGTAGGRRLATPPGSGTRPTSDRVREAIFSQLDHAGVLHGARVLDLYAGSGALGLEALSRGAAYACLVESARPVASVVSRNARDLGFADVEVVCSRVERYVSGSPPASPFDVVFLDPPYDVGEADLGRVLRDLGTAGWLAREAVVVVERSSRTAEPDWGSLVRDREKTYGETRVWYASPAAPE
jgi:16S rRNA (guanine966-N2)-methyltransferase